jgi:hypothetical protein
MTQKQYTPSSVWPQPNQGLDYVTQSFDNNGDFVSTGQYDPAVIGPKGQGRTSDNCKKVTSLFFDADFIALYDAARLAFGEELEPKVADRKKKLWALDDSIIAELKDMVSEVREVLSTVMGAVPTATVDSGWGFHYHYAVDGFTPDQHGALKDFHISVVKEVNRRICESFKLKGIPAYDSALDNTNDVGARLARVVGSINSKCEGKPKTVVLLNETTTCLRPCNLEEILPRCTPTAQSSSSARTGKPASSGKLSRQHVDFRTKHMDDGRTWREVVDTMTPGERLNVVCPCGGTSIGSAFFVLDADYRCRLTSNATQTVYMDTAWGVHVDLQGGGNTPPPPPPSTPVTPSAAPPPSGRSKPNPRHRAVLTMRRDRDGNATTVPEPTDLNLIRVLANDGRLDLWYDAWLDQEMNGDAPLNENLYMTIRLMLEMDYNWATHKPSKELIWDSIKSVCAERPFNPVQHYVKQLKWDGVSRLNTWVYNVIHAPGVALGINPDQDLSLHEIYARKWVISMVARAMDPGCKVDTMMILAGLQAFQKSTIWRTWGGDWFVDTEFDPNSKDKYMVLARSWVYEDAELSSGGRAAAEARKAFLSSQEDTYRSPYARGVRTSKRHCVIVGSTNDHAFLKDRTGDRRYWVVSVPRIAHLSATDARQPRADIEWLRANRDQLLAEAYVAWQQGEQHWLTQEEDQTRASENAPYRQESVWDECAAAVFEANAGGMKNAITVVQFAQACDSDMSPSDVAKIASILAACLDGAGFCKGKKVKGRTFWYKPLPTGVDPEVEQGLHAARGSGARVEPGGFRL